MAQNVWSCILIAVCELSQGEEQDGPFSSRRTGSATIKFSTLEIFRFHVTEAFIQHVASSSLPIEAIF